MNKKLNKSAQEKAERWELLDADTWMPMTSSELFESSKKGKVKETRYFKFTIMNKKVDELYPKIWASHYWHLTRLIHNIAYDNSVDYWVLSISKYQIDKVKKVLRDNNIVKRGKLSDSRIWKYYMNPWICTYWDRYNPELDKIFE